MARYVPATNTTSPGGKSPPVVIAQIVDIEDRDGPKAAYSALVSKLDALRREGQIVPASLASLEQRLLTQCYAESQGR